MTHPILNIAGTRRPRYAPRSGGFRFEPLENRLLLALLLWDAGGDGHSWSDPLNWSADALPTLDDDALIPAGFDPVRITTDALARSLMAHSPVHLLREASLRTSTFAHFTDGLRAFEHSSLHAGTRLTLDGPGNDTVVRLSGIFRSPRIDLDAKSAVLHLIDLRLDATSTSALGGAIDAFGSRVVLESTTLDASGPTGGGSIRVGGELTGAPIHDRSNAEHAYLDESSFLRADATASGHGGRIILWSDGVTGFYGRASVRGGPLGGDGGFVETSGKDALDVTGIVDAIAPTGASGSWLLDPRSVTVSNAAQSGGAFSGGNPTTFTPTADNAVVNAGSVSTALQNGTSVTITTGSTGTQSGSITILASITPSGLGGSTLTLRAAGDIIISANISASSTTPIHFVFSANDSTPGPDPDPASGNVLISAAVNITVANGTISFSGVTFSTQTTGTINAPTITANMSGDIQVNGDLIASTRIELNAGNYGTGNLSFGAAGVDLRSPTIILRAGNGTGGATAAAADLNTNTPIFRGFSGGATRPSSFTYRQDASIANAAVPLASSFGASVSGMTYRIESDDGSVTVSTSSKVNGSALTLIAAANVTFSAGMTGGNLSIGADSDGNGSGTASITTAQNLSQILVQAASISTTAAASLSSTNSAFFAASASISLLGPVTTVEGIIFVQAITVTIGANLQPQFGVQLVGGSGGITQTGGAILANNLIAAATGPVSLPGNNNVNNVALSATGNLTFNDIDGFTITAVTVADSLAGAISTGVTALSVSGATGAISISAGVSSETFTSLNAPGGASTSGPGVVAGNSLVLRGGGAYVLATNIGNLASNANALISITESNSLAVSTVDGVSGISGTSSDVTLTTGAGAGLALNSPINLGDGRLRINSDGAVTQAPGGTIQSVGSLVLSGAGNVSLTNSANNTINLAASGTGSLTYTDTNAVIITSVLGITGVNRSGGVTITAGGALTVSAPVSATTAVSLRSGTSGAGNLTFGSAGITVTSPNIALIAGDGLGGAATALVDANTNNPTFRASAIANPTSFAIRQDNAITDAQIPLTARFVAGNTTGLNYTLESFNSTITIVTAAKVAGANLTTAGISNNVFNVAINVASLTVFGTSLITASPITASGAVTFNGEPTFTTNLTINAAQLTATAIVSGGTTNSLIANVSGRTSLQAGAALASLTTNAGGATNLAGTFTFFNALTFNDPVTLIGHTTITPGPAANAVVFNSTLNAAAFNLAIAARAIDFLGGANSVSGTGVLSLRPDTNSRPVLIFDNSVTPGLQLSPTDMAAIASGFSMVNVGLPTSNTTLTIRPGIVFNPFAFFSGPGGSISVQDGVNSIENRAIGAPLIFDAPSTLAAFSIISAGGNISFTGAVSLSNDTVINTTGGSLTFNSTINSASATPRALAVATGANSASFSGAVGNAFPLSTLSVNSASILAAAPSITTTSAQSFSGLVTFSSPATAISASTASFIGGASGFLPGAQQLTVTGNATFAGAPGAVGSPTPLGRLQVSGNASFANAVSLSTAGGLGGTLSVAGVTTLAGPNDSVHTFSSPGGSFTFSGGLIASTPGEQGINITGNLFLAPGSPAASPLRSLTVSGTTALTGPGTIRTSAIGGGSGAQNFGGPVTTAGATTFEAFSGILTFSSTLSTGSNQTTLRARGFAFADNVTGSGALAFEADVTSINLLLGGSDGPGGAIDFTAASLSRLQDGFASITFGAANYAANITIASPYVARDPITFRSPVAPGSITVNAPLSATGNGSFTFIGSGTTTTLNADVRTSGQPITFNDAVLIGVPLVTVDSTNNGLVPAGAPITFAFSIDSEPEEENALALRAGSAALIALQGPVGGAITGRLGALSTDSSPAAIQISASINALTHTYARPLTVLAPATLTGQSISALAVNGSGAAASLALAGSGPGAAATFSGPVGLTTALTSFASAPSIRSIFLASPVRATGAIALAGPIEFSLPLTVIGGSVALTGGITGNNNALTINSPGLTTLGGSIAGLASLLTDAPGSTQIIGPSLAATGNVTFLDPVSVAADAAISSLAAVLTFASTLNAGPHTVALSGVEINFLAAVAGTGTLRILQSNPAQNYNLAHSTEGAGDALDITAAELNLFQSGFELLEFGLDDGAALMSVESYTFNAPIQINMPAMGGEIAIAGDIIVSSDNGTIGVRGNGSTTHLFGNLITRGGAITIDDSLLLGLPTILLDTTAGGFAPAPVSISGRVNSAPSAAHALRVRASIMTFEGEVGSTPAGRPGFLDITAPGGTFLLGPAFRTIGAQTYTGPVTLGPSVFLQTVGAPITVTGGVDGQSNLTIGSGTGAVNFGGAVGSLTTLTSLTINAGAMRVFAGAVNVQVLTVFGGAVEFNGPTTVGAGLLIAGTLGGSGLLQVDLPFTWVGGDMIGSGATIIRASGALVLSGGAKTLSRSIENFGTAFWTDGSLNFVGGAFINRPTGQFFAQSTGAFVGVSGANAFTNEGDFERSGPGTASLTNLTVANAGDMRFLQGDLAITPAAATVFQNSGRLDLGASALLSVAGPVNFTASSTFATALAGTQPGQFGRLVATGPVAVNGALVLTLANNFIPAGGDRFTIIAGAAVSGTFASESFPSLPGQQFMTTYNPADVTIVLAGGLDFNGDGVVDADDLGDFINAFFSVPPGPGTDFNGDGVVDADDLGDFINAFFGR